MKTRTFMASFLLLISPLLFFAITFLVKVDSVKASFMKNSITPSSRIVEYLRLKVPAKYRSEWLMAEEKSWSPWLAQKEGFLDRQLLWDKKKEEALLLIFWSNKEYWKKIPQSEIDEVQSLFEKVARELTHKDVGNPFPITFEGELLPQ